MSLTQSEQDLVAAVWDHYGAAGRHDLPWRQPEPDSSFDPYKILVSEIMLQQTQVIRVMPKYASFLKRFPSLDDLATADQAAVLRAWSGLGYNRRARYLHQAAQVIKAEFDGTFPTTEEALVGLPGIGKNTAGAIIAYAFNQQAVFIETNVRTVYLHHLFPGQDSVDDAAIRLALERTLPGEGEYRDWYWALMDYGSWLKATGVRVNSQSKGYKKQSVFAGSQRQLRGLVLKLLAERSRTEDELRSAIVDERLAVVLNNLQDEGMIQQSGSHYAL